MSMGSVGKGGKVKSSGAEEDLLKTALQMTNEAAPLRGEVLRQGMEAMTTGGIGARLPIAQKGVEASRAATSSAMSQLNEGMARGGMGGSTASDVLRSSTLLQGELATNAIPQDVAAQMIAVAPTMALGFGGQGLSGLGSATGAATQRAGIQSQRDIAKGQQQTEMITSAMQMVGGAAAMACWIAARLYGEFSPEYYAARHFIFFMWKGRLATLVRKVYLRYGERVARHRWACELLRPLFALAVRRGLEASRVGR